MTTTQRDLATIVEWLQADDHTAAYLAHVRSFPPRSATYDTPRSLIHARLRERLDGLGYGELYSHQAHAFDAAMSGEDVVVVTGTNSGKTLCYNLPAVQKLMAEPVARALYLYPTKALTQDQRGKLEDLLKGTDLRCATYDGDTPPSRRGTIRKMAHIILSNPDMLHVGILPGHELWSKFLKSLRLIVIDEMHIYRGVFGSHVGGVLRRLLRLCEWHRSRPQIIACSATIGNPQELFEHLTGRRPTLIAEDGAPKAKRTFIFWSRARADEREGAVGLGKDGLVPKPFSANYETAKLLQTFASAGLRTLAFSRARVSAELVLKYARQLGDKSADAVDATKLESYRAGYTPKERRQIEQALFKGDLLGLSSTNAMELGVDVGGLDVVVMNGYPGTISSFWQQAGRAGRGTRDGLAVMIAHDDPLEQFICREPNLVFAADTERVAANPFNPQILSQQLRCAAYERPISPHELSDFGDSALDLAEGMDRAGELHFSAGRFYYPSHEPPAPRVNIRGSGGDQVTLFLTHLQGASALSDPDPSKESDISQSRSHGAIEELGSMEHWRALQSAHEGAVYLHRGVSYVVESLDLKTSQAHLVAKRVDYYTQALVQSTIDPRAPFGQIRLGIPAEESTSPATSQPPNLATLAGLKVTDIIAGYRVKSLDDDRTMAIHDLDLPPTTYDTVGIQLTLGSADVPSRPIDAQRGEPTPRPWSPNALPPGRLSPDIGRRSAGSSSIHQPDPFPRSDLPSFHTSYPEPPSPNAELAAALHGLEHALMAVAPIIAGCDRGDLGSAWYVAFQAPINITAPQHLDADFSSPPCPTLFVFDRTPGGVGLSEKLFDSLPAWMSAALQLLTSCPCRDGCPACLLSSRCAANNELLDKQGAIYLLRTLSGRHSNGGSTSRRPGP